MSETKRPARQPVVGKPAAESDVLGEDDTQRLVASRPPRSEVRKCIVNMQWLEEHVDIVRSVVGSHIDSIRLALDVVGTQFNASGMTLDDALSRPFDEACFALRCFMANIQVWGSLGSLREPLCPAVDRDIELFLQKGVQQNESPDVVARLSKLSQSLTPDRLAAYHRQLSRALVAQVRREFRQHLSTIRRLLESSTRDDASPGSQLCLAILSHFREIESFMTAIYRFFKCVDIAGNPGSPPPPPELGCMPMASDAAASDDSEEGREQRPLRPTLDRTTSGYTMCIDCGHNGILNEGEVQHLGIYIRAARFGKYAEGSSCSKDPGNVV